MDDLLVTLILTICPQSTDGTNKCQERFINCAVTSTGAVTTESIQKCLEKFKREKLSNSSDR